jgi:hypothetical protein
MGCSWFNTETNKKKTSINNKSHRALKLKRHFAAGALGDSIRFGIFVVYQFHPGT